MVSRGKEETMIGDVCVLLGFWAMILLPSLVAMRSVKDKGDQIY